MIIILRLLFINLNRLALVTCLLLSTGLSAKELKINTIDIFPFGYTSPDGQATGLIYEISNKIAQTAGFTFTNILAPYPRTIINLKNGNADFVIRYTNAELNKIAFPVASIISFQTIIFGNKDGHFKSLKDLRGKTIGKIRGGIFDDHFEEDKEIEKYEVNDYDQLFKMLLAKRYDAIIGSSIGLYSNAKKMNISRKELGRPLHLQHKFFVLHLTKKNIDQKTIEALKLAIHKLEANGEILRIVKSYEESILKKGDKGPKSSQQFNLLTSNDCNTCLKD
ncbi:MAG: transporter substrate-binding domain-containing protein [Bacteriovorax sp.]|nr:transporter substrate-binding domain-containing protein [Bacteriovorax sp.]